MVIMSLFSKAMVSGIMVTMAMATTVVVVAVMPTMKGNCDNACDVGDREGDDDSGHGHDGKSEKGDVEMFIMVVFCLAWMVITSRFWGR